MFLQQIHSLKYHISYTAYLQTCFNYLLHDTSNLKRNIFLFSFRLLSDYNTILFIFITILFFHRQTTSLFLSAYIHKCFGYYSSFIGLVKDAHSSCLGSQQFRLWYEQPELCAIHQSFRAEKITRSSINILIQCNKKGNIIICSHANTHLSTITTHKHTSK